MRRNGKRWIGALLGIILVSNYGLSVQATGETNEYEQARQDAYNQKIETNEISGWPQGPQVYPESAIVMDMDTGAILYGKGIDRQQYPASITKVLTALVAIENSELTDTVTFSQESIDCLESGYAHIAMNPGEQITMKDALHGLLLASANEVAYAIGESVGGTHEHFVEMMNEKAAELGCKNTHFINTNGMFDEEHYTSARDMALITQAAFKHQELLDIVQTLQYTIPPTNLQPEARTFQQKHKMLLHGRYYDERCIAGKTGYTDKAHNTLVTVMQQGDKRLVVAILNSRKDTFEATKQLSDYGFDNFKRVNIASNEKSGKLKDINTEACVTLPNDVEFTDLTSKVDKKGNLNYYYKGLLVGTTKVSLKQETKISGAKKQKEKSVTDKRFIIKIAVITLIAIVVVFLIVLVLAIERKNRLRRARRRRMIRDREKRMKHEKTLWD